MKQYAVQLRSRRMVAERTMEVSFSRPAGFDFAAGQFLKITLPVENGTRSMSIASAPYEDELTLVMRIPENPSSFKQLLQTMPIGSEAKISGPFGHLVLDTNVKRPVVFIAGGIGITPFRSILRQEAHAPTGRTIRLLYSNRNYAQATYFDELRALPVQRYAVTCTMTKMSPQETKELRCESGYITGEFVKQHTQDLENPLYYIVGLPEMVTATRSQLLDLGVQKEDIKIELYSGY